MQASSQQQQLSRFLHLLLFAELSLALAQGHNFFIFFLHLLFILSTAAGFISPFDISFSNTQNYLNFFLGFPSRDQKQFASIIQQVDNWNVIFRFSGSILCAEYMKVICQKLKRKMLCKSDFFTHSHLEDQINPIQRWKFTLASFEIVHECLQFLTKCTPKTRLRRHSG